MGKEAGKKKGTTVEELERSLDELAALTGSDEDELETADEQDEVEAADESEEEEVEASADEDGGTEDSDEAEDEEAEEEEPVQKSAKSKKLVKSARRVVKVDDEDEPEMEKSLGDRLYEDSNVMKAVDISPFIESLVEKNAEMLDELASEIREDRQNIGQMLKAFSKSYRGIADALKAFNTRLDSIEQAPAKPKGKVTVLERSLQGAPSPEQQKQAEAKDKQPQLTKSMVADALEALHQDGKVAEFDVIRFETSNFLAPAVQKKVLDYWSNGKAA